MMIMRYLCLMRIFVLIVCVLINIPVSVAADDYRELRGLNILLKIGGLNLTSTEPRVAKLIAGGGPDIAKWSCDEGYRIWMFGEWGDKMIELKYAMSPQGYVLRGARRVSSKDGYEIRQSEDPSLSSDEMVEKLHKILSDPIPLPSQNDPPDNSDSGVVIVEAVLGGKSKWAVRSEALVSKEEFNTMTRLAAEISNLKWSAK